MTWSDRLLTKMAITSKSELLFFRVFDFNFMTMEERNRI